MSEIILYQFPASHYNEKVRWALDIKQVPHRRISLLPGPHARVIKPLTGNTETPVLVDDGKIIAGSAAILAHLDQRFPQPPLLPAESAERERALAIAKEFDETLGPAIRVAKYFDVWGIDYIARTFSTDKPALVRLAYRAVLPLVVRVMKQSMQINADNSALGREETRRALDFVAKEGAARTYLVGDRFSIADLTCAALLMPAVDVSELGGPPLKNTDAERAWFARWEDHPGAAWVREIYRRHRCPPEN